MCLQPCRGSNHGLRQAAAQGGSRDLDYRVDLSVQGVDHRATGVACVPVHVVIFF